MFDANQRTVEHQQNLVKETVEAMRPKTCKCPRSGSCIAACNLLLRHSKSNPVFIAKAGMMIMIAPVGRNPNNSIKKTIPFPYQSHISPKIRPGTLEARLRKAIWIRDILPRPEWLVLELGRRAMSSLSPEEKLKEAMQGKLQDKLNRCLSNRICPNTIDGFSLGRSRIRQYTCQGLQAMELMAVHLLATIKHVTKTYTTSSSFFIGSYVLSTETAESEAAQNAMSENVSRVLETGEEFLKLSPAECAKVDRPALRNQLTKMADKVADSDQTSPGF